MDSRAQQSAVRRLRSFCVLFVVLVLAIVTFRSSIRNQNSVGPAHRHDVRAPLPQDPAASTTTSSTSMTIMPFFTSTSTSSTSNRATTSSVLPLSTASSTSTRSSSSSISSTTSSAAAATALTVLQLAPPVTINTTTGGVAACEATLMQTSFSQSFGKPFVGNYSPPACATNSNRAIMSFRVQAKGEQFDRLAIMYLGDNEVFRTSTAEPTQAGIEWEYVKDMSAYMVLWKQPQKMIFDLPNQVTANLTGAYNTTLTVTYSNISMNTVTTTPANMIIPISARKGVNDSSSSVFSVPGTNATNTISFPRNANRAVFTVNSAGQGTEEFWWSNFLQSDITTYGPGAGALGYSPFREVQLYIDGKMAGVQWPFPVIFTGGVAPGLWSPVVGIDAFDLKEYEIDITPWLPVLCDGNMHTFTMKVVGLVDDGKTGANLSEMTNSSWDVSGNVFVWLDAEGSVTTGSAMTMEVNAPTISVSQTLGRNSSGGNDTLTYTTSVQRTMTISSTVKTQSGSQTYSWSQTLSHTDLGSFVNNGNSQVVQISTIGVDTSMGAVPYSNSYSYPLFANTTQTITGDGSVTFVADVRRTKNIEITGKSVIPSNLQAFATYPSSSAIVSGAIGHAMTTTQNGTASLLQAPGGNASTFGSTSQEMRLGAISAAGTMGMEPNTELFFRTIAAVNGTVRTDMERLVGQQSNPALVMVGKRSAIPRRKIAQRDLNKREKKLESWG